MSNILKHKNVCKLEDNNIEFSVVFSQGLVKIPFGEDKTGTIDYWPICDQFYLSHDTRRLSGVDNVIKIAKDRMSIDEYMKLEEVGDEA